jgi:hypothetical protein
LQHHGDIRTNIQVTIDNYEIVIRIDGFPLYLSNIFDEQSDKKEMIDCLFQILGGKYTLISYSANGTGTTTSFILGSSLMLQRI